MQLVTCGMCMKRPLSYSLHGVIRGSSMLVNMAAFGFGSTVLERKEQAAAAGCSVASANFLKPYSATSKVSFIVRDLKIASKRDGIEPAIKGSHPT